MLFGCNLVTTRKTKIKEWKIDKYNIKLYKQAGAFGPTTYKYYLDKNKVIPSIFYKKRSKVILMEQLSNCTVNFTSKKKDSLSFNLCERKDEIELPGPKERLDSYLISKIEVIKIDPSGTRSVILNQTQKELVIKEWNKKSDHLLGSPKILFLIIVSPYSGAIRTFISDGRYI